MTTYKLAGGVYEVIVNGSTTIQKSYVDGVILNTRTLVNGVQTANETQYLHTDHLGSTEAITNALGQFINRMSFSAWGERQKSDWKPGPLTSTELNTYNTITTNGYTGHDQLDSHNLIHMGGRVYDPNLGRFLSADLFIQSPYDSQSYSRYSYTFNNPLSYTDPSGYLNDKSGKSPSQQNFNYAFHQAVSGCDNSGCTVVGQRPSGLTGDAAHQFMQSQMMYQSGMTLFYAGTNSPNLVAVGNAFVDPSSLQGQIMIALNEGLSQANAELDAAIAELAEHDARLANLLNPSFVFRNAMTINSYDGGVWATGYINDQHTKTLITAIATVVPVGGGAGVLAKSGEAVGLVSKLFSFTKKATSTIQQVNPKNLISQQSKNEMSGSVIKRLAKDMKINGFDQNQPISAVVRGDGRLVISDGHHRAAAAIRAGIEKVPVDVFNPLM